MSNPITITLRTTKYVPFLNTGHHFIFVPFTDPTEEASAVIKEFIGDEVRWAIAFDETRAKNLLWLRGRPTKQGDEDGLLVVIETNVGGTSRGWPTAPKAIVPLDTFERQKEAASANEPYIFSDPAEAPRDTMSRQVQFGFIRADGSKVTIRLPLAMEFPHEVAEPLAFDLIVDFGNTRTVVLAIEQNKAANGFLSQICRPITFTPRNSEPGDVERSGSSSAIIDSWFVLAEPLFSSLEPPSEDGRSECPIYVHEFSYKTEKRGFWIFARDQVVPDGSKRNIPQSCVQLSPAIMGAEADPILSLLPLELGGNSFLSSPKRYSWDNDPVGSLAHVGQSYWTMAVNHWHPRYSNYYQKKEFPKLAATVLQLMDETGADWSLTKTKLPTERASAEARPPHSPNSPSYPRSDALTWAALNVLENAYRHVMSEQWRSAMGHKFVQRRLRNVLVTFPSGWTSQELSSYRAKWQKALDIFSTCHLSRETPQPKLLMELDEAVASQLPIIYGEMVRLGNSGENWLELVGRGTGTDARARIMNLDIGGGTTDIAIIEYYDEIPGSGVGLNAELLHKDSSTVAGDMLVRRITEAVLLPAISQNIKNEQTRRRFSELLRSAKQDRTAKWNRVTRQVFIPIVRHWLRELTEAESSKTLKGFLAPERMLSGDTSSKILEFNTLCSEHLKSDIVVLSASEPLSYDRSRLAACVGEVFGDYIVTMTKVFTAFDCDFLIVSGKPSELPELRDLILTCMPVPRSRIVFSYNYPVGDWYPLSTNGRIDDAKTVTVAGAALYLAIRDALLPGWMIRPSVVSRFVSRNYWGLISQTGHDDFRVILPPQENEAKISLMIEATIGRRALPTRTKPDPVYRLRWSSQGRQRGVGAALVSVTLRRIVPDKTEGAKDPFDSVGEYLELISVEGTREGKAVELSDLELQLCTLGESDHWMDAGIYYMEGSL